MFGLPWKSNSEYNYMKLRFLWASCITVRMAALHQVIHTQVKNFTKLTGKGVAERLIIQSYPLFIAVPSNHSDL